MKIKFVQRIGILLLFIIALYTTVTTVSNVTITDLKNVLINGNSSVKAATHLKEDRQTALKEKTLNYQMTEKKYISSGIEEEAMTLEEAIDFQQYPSTTVLATGYTAGIESTGKTPSHPGYGITYSGVVVKRDLYSTIAADLNVYPIGTIMYIPDYGYGVVADKGGAITGSKIDLYYHTVEDVYSQWGKKEVEVFVIEMGSGTLTEDQLVQLNENETLQVFRDQYIN